MSLIVDKFLRDISISSEKCIFRQSRVTSFQHFPLSTYHAVLNLRNLNISSPDFYLLNVGMSDVKELLARSRREIWYLSDCNWTRTLNHLVHKRTLKPFSQACQMLSECFFRNEVVVGSSPIAVTWTFTGWRKR